MARKFSKPDQTIAQAITRAMNGGAPLTTDELSRLTPAERKGAEAIIKQNTAAIKVGKASPVTDPKLTGVAKSDVIATVASATTGGDHTIITAEGQPAYSMAGNKMTGAIRKLAVKGGSYSAVVAAYKAALANSPVAKLARGVDGHNSPQSSEAVKQARAKGKISGAKASARDAGVVRKELRKAEKTAKAAPKADDTRAIKILKKDYAFGREGTARRSSWDACLKAANVQAYLKAGGAAKYLPRWVSAGAIKLG